MINHEFWKNRRVFLTGHTGFKGAWLAIWLNQLKSDVTGYALDPALSPNLFDTTRISKEINSIRGDVRDLNQLKKSIQEAQPEIIFHLAAQALVRESYNDPIGTYDTNIMGTVNLLEAAREVKSVKAIVVITSDKCYENKEWLYGYRENEPMGGHDPYSSSKGCAELVTTAYYRSFLSNLGIGVASARAGNVIGGGDWSLDRLVPDFIRARLSNGTIRLRNPKSVRPWQHVIEPLAGYMSLAEKLTMSPEIYSGAWNFGPNTQNYSDVASVIGKLNDLSNKKVICEIDESGHHPHEANLLMLDIAKAKYKLNWEPRWNLSQALREVLTWQHAFESGKDMRQECIKQISNYFENTIGVKDESIQTDYAIGNV